MSSYDSSSQLIDSTTQLIYSRTPPAIIQQHVQDTFHLLDTTNKGYLTRHDLKCAIILLLGYTPSHIELNTLLTTTHSTLPNAATTTSQPPSPLRLTEDQFVALLTRRMQQQDTLHYFQHLFSAFDTQHNGYIRKQDFLSVCDRVVVSGGSGSGDERGGGGVVLDESVLSGVFDVCDVDGDGLISYREFDRLMSARPYSTMG